jgi:hypothetical protein|tara:strand:- start:1041 stop:1895 length:855 start_codon:yes stop_codon:yes gene_type:complete
VYRYVDKKTFLDWGLTSDWLVEGPRKRRASSLFSAPSALGTSTSGSPASSRSEYSEEEDPNASSEGYGEMTEGSIERLLGFLRELATGATLAAPLPCATPEKGTRSVGSEGDAASALADRWNLGPSSGFIDVGSGYGKVVLHAKLSGAGVGEAVGVEYVPRRASLAAAAKRELESGKLGFVTAEAAARLRDPRGCRLLQGDATEWGPFRFTHVYMYDKVFSEPTIELLAKQLNASPYRVLVSYQRREVWRRCGLRRFTEVAALTMRTTGGQNFKAYVFINENAV